MIETLKKARILNANTLKLLAAFFMVFDHFGLVFYPEVMWWRAVGRLSMPLFAFAISEGCRYTRNKTKHFLLLFGLGVACQIVYYIFDPANLYFGILITFSFSILLIYALQFFKAKVFNKECKVWEKCVSFLPFFLLLIFVNLFCKRFTVDYGFYGVLMPVFASLFDFHRIPAPEKVQKLDCLPLRIVCMFIPLLLLTLGYDGELYSIVFYAFLALPILLLYNGQKGKRNMKYFFYIFYPLHLGLIEGAYIVMYIVRNI